MARLKAIGTRIKAADLSTAKLPPKTADPYYKSGEWLALRRAVLARDGHRCTVAGCAGEGVVVDHIVSRRNGGADAMANLRTLCRAHDSRIKEAPDGSRRGGGRLD